MRNSYGPVVYSDGRQVIDYATGDVVHDNQFPRVSSFVATAINNGLPYRLEQDSLTDLPRWYKVAEAISGHWPKGHME
jgi:hypothetical protein